MARTCPASSVNATIRAGVSAFDAACQQRGAKRTARERSGNAAGSKPRAGKYGSDGSTTCDSPKSSSGGFFSGRRLLRCRTMRPLASIASRIASRSQPAWHLTAIFPSRSSLTPHDAVLSSCAGQRKSCQPDAEAAPDPPKARRSLSRSGCCRERLASRAPYGHRTICSPVRSSADQAKLIFRLAIALVRRVGLYGATPVAAAPTIGQQLVWAWAQRLTGRLHRAPHEVRVGSQSTADAIICCC